MGSEWGQLHNKKKKKWKKEIFSLYHSSSHLKITRTLPVLWLNKASHGNPKGTIGCRIECSIQPWGQNEASFTTKKKKNEKKDFFSIYHYHPVTVSTNIACFLVEPSVSQKCQGHHWMQNWMLYSTMGSEWGQLDNKGQKKMKTKIFSAFISTTRLQFPRTLPVLWLNKASHRNAKGTIGCRIECSIQQWGQNEASWQQKTKKNENKDFFSIYQYHPVTVSTNIACFLVEPSVSQKCQGHHWMQNWMLYSNMGSEWGQLHNKRKKKSKNRFFQHLSAPPGYSFHEHCLFSGWTKRLTEMPRAPLDAELNALFNHGVRMRPAGQQKTKKNENKDFFSIYQYHPVTVSTNIACFVVEQSVSQKSQGHHWMQNWMLYSTMGLEWGQLDNKKKKNEKKIFFQHLSLPPGYSFHEHCLFSRWTKRLREMPRAPLDVELNALFNHGVRMRPAWQQKKKKWKKNIFSAFITTTRLQFPRTLPVFSLNKASHRNAKGTIGCRIECSIQTWGQNEASLTTKEKKNKKIDFFSIYQYHPVTDLTNIACFVVEQSVSEKCQGHHWMQNWMLYSTMGLEWGQLDNKKKKNEKKIFFQHLSLPPGYSFHEHCLFSRWTKRLREMPRAPLDAELNALFNHGVRMRPAWQQKKKKWKKNIFSAFITTTRLQFPRTLPVFSLNQASQRNAKGTIGCRIECSIQPWGQNEASWTTKKEKNEKKDFFGYITAVVTWRFQEHCLFSGWRKRLTEMPRAPLDAEFKALFNHGLRIRPAWQQKQKKWKEKFFRYITAVVTWKFHEHCLFYGLNWASHRNAKGTIGCRIVCSMQPWGQNEASLATKKKKKWKKNFFVISQQ